MLNFPSDAYFARFYKIQSQSSLGQEPHEYRFEDLSLNLLDEIKMLSAFLAIKKDGVIKTRKKSLNLELQLFSY